MKDFFVRDWFLIQPMDQGVIQSLKAKYCSRMTQQIIKAIDANKSIPTVNVLDAMKMLTVCWEEVTEETVKKCFTKSHISAQDQASTQNDLDDPFIELGSNMEKLKSLGVVVIPEEVTSEEYANFDDTVTATEPVLSDESILATVREDEEPIEVEDDQQEGDNKIEVNDNCLEKSTPIQLRSVIETLLDFSLFMESEEVQRCTMKILGFMENELSQNLKQASIKDYFA